MSDDGMPRRATIRDVAAAAGVSKSLVALVYADPSRVSPERTRRVLDAAHTLGFAPNLVARSLAGAVDFVAILVADLHNPLFADIVVAARDELAERGIPSLLSSLVGDSSEVSDLLTLTLVRDLRPTGVLVVGSIPKLGDVLQLATARTRVVVASAIPPAEAEIVTVRGDDAAGIRLAVDHLVGLGHRRIAHAGGEGGAVAVARRAAYEQAMTAHGLAAEIRIAAADFSEASGRRAAEQLLATDAKPTAIVAVNDLAAVGVLAVAAERGLQVAVTGYDNTSVAALPQLSLTSVEPGNVEIGRRCAAALAGDVGAGTVLVAPTLVVRASTGPPS